MHDLQMLRLFQFRDVASPRPYDQRGARTLDDGPRRCLICQVSFATREHRPGHKLPETIIHARGDGNGDEDKRAGHNVSLRRRENYLSFLVAPDAVRWSPRALLPAHYRPRFARIHWLERCAIYTAIAR
jgi:hypothetical protein